MEEKENFCAACVVIPLAFVGAGTNKLGSKHDPLKNDRALRKRNLIISVVIAILSCAIVYYYREIKDCGDCR